MVVVPGSAAGVPEIAHDGRSDMNKQLGLVFLVGLLAFIGGVTSEALWRSSASAQGRSPLPPPPSPTLTDYPVELFESVVQKVLPSVVAVDAIKPSTASTGGTNSTKKSVEESGSGVIVRLSGQTRPVVVTNNHVVGQAAPEKVYITMHDGRILRPSQILADPESDVCLMRLEATDLPSVELADSDRVRRGQWVLAFGSPFGLSQTVTHGIISAMNRGQISLGSTIRIKEFLQTDAAINPGSSGGPLVDMSGQVVGINTAIASQNGSNSGVAFSIPANLVKRVARQLFDKGYVSRGYLGVQLATSLDPAEALRLGLDRVNGALVEVVHPSTPAEAAGLKPGDVILKLEDIPVRDENHLINLISALPANHRVRLGVWRERRLQVVEVVVGEWGARQPNKP